MARRCLRPRVGVRRSTQDRTVQREGRGALTARNCISWQNTIEQKSVECAVRADSEASLGSEKTAASVKLTAH